MAYVRLLSKASKIEKLKLQLEEEKKKAVEVSKGKRIKFGLKQKYRHFWIDLKEDIKNCLIRKCTCPRTSCIYQTIYKLKHDGTCENFTFKSIIGFIGGCFLTYMCYMFFVFQLNFKLSTATIMCSIVGSILTIGLAFSFKVRCVVFLLLPQLFSKRGRQALMAYAFILAITGPAKNTLHNMGILSESLACGQEQLKAAVKQIMEVVKKPFYAIRDAIRTVVKTVKVIVKKIKEVLLTIKRIILAILRVIKAAFQFLGKILNICNKELGTPFERCSKVFEDAITDCHAKLGPLFSWLCSITYLVKSVCYIVKIFDVICVIVDFISDSIIGVVVRKVKIFVRHIRTMFYVRIKFSHSFHFETTQSKSVSDIAAGIVTEIKQRTEKLLTVFDFMSCTTSLFFLFIVLRVLNYRYKFLTSERFDNRFITKDFRNIDMKRAQMDKETVLPLNHRERAFYISVTSLRLVKSERVKLSKSAVVLGMTTLKLSTHMMADYALYWMLTIIRYHAKFQSSVPAPNIIGLHVEGEGFLAKLLKSIVKAFQPLGVKLEIDTVPCLPDPIPPDYDRYIQIVSLLALCWILTIFEPYGLRLRHSVMCYYHPTRAKQRAIWLYNHIIRSRSSFLKFARRQLRRKAFGTKGITKITCKEYLRANINSRWLRMCLGSDKQEACILCAEVFRESDEAKPIRCSKPGCPGIYCAQCYADLKNLCTICMEPIQYGDLSDISEEKDSSADEVPQKIQKSKKKCRISKCCKKREDESDKDDEDTTTDQDRLLESTGESEYHGDSDYHSDGTTTDNSYTYQDVKDLTSQTPVKDPSSSVSRDVEMQRIPDYATWEDTHLESREGQEEDVTTRPSSSYSSIISELKFRYTSKEKTPEDSNAEVQFRPSSPNESEYLVHKQTSTTQLKEELKKPLLGKEAEDELPSKTKKRPKGMYQRLFYSCLRKQESSPTGSEEETSLLLNSRPQDYGADYPSSFTTKVEEYLQHNQDFLREPDFQEAVELDYRTRRPDAGNEPMSWTFERTERSSPAFVKQKPFSSTSSSIDSEICRKYQKHPVIPRLNLNFESSGTSDLCTSSGDRFKRNIKFEVVEEKSKSPSDSYSSPTTVSPRGYSARSPLNVGYQIYVPRYDKFVDRTQVFKEPERDQYESCKVEKWMDNQRQERMNEITGRLNRSGNFGDPVSPEISSCRNRKVSCMERPQEARQRYKQNVSNYYKKINKKQPPDNPRITKDQNKLFKFIKMFRKGRTQEAVSFTSYGAEPNSSSCCGTPNFELRTFTPISPGNLEAESAECSLMGGAISHIRGGADRIKSFTKASSTGTKTSSTGTSPYTTTTDSATTQTKHSGNTNLSSDSDISDVDIFFSNGKAPEILKRKQQEQKSSAETFKTDANKSITSAVTENPSVTRKVKKQRPSFVQEAESQAKAENSKTELNSKTDLKGKQQSLPILPTRTSKEEDSAKSNTKRNSNINSQVSSKLDFVKNNAKRDSSINSQAASKISMNVGTTSNATVEQTPLFSREAAERDQDTQTTQITLQKYYPIPGDSMQHLPDEDDYRSPPTKDTYPLPPPHPPEKYFNTSMLNDTYRNHPQRTSGIPVEYYPKIRCGSEERRSMDRCCGGKDYPYPSRPIYRTPKLDHIRSSVQEPKKFNRNFEDLLPVVDNGGAQQFPQDYCACNSFEVTPAEIPSRRLMDDELSCCSGCSCRSEYLDLAYQNTDEFYDLVNELGDTLSQRNRERVQKTMREFEIRSRQNKNLEKPIFDDESDDNSRPCRMKNQKRNRFICNRCCRPRKSFSPPRPCNVKFTRFEASRENPSPYYQPEEGHVEQVVKHMDPNRDDSLQKYPKFHQRFSNTHWEMDPRTGEWFKTYGNYGYEENYYTEPQKESRRECLCDRNLTKYNGRGPPEPQPRGYPTPPPVCRCSNCGYLRSSRY